jgi:hypothetical protein
VSKKRDRAFEQLAEIGDEAEHIKEAVDALVAATRETLALVDITPEACHEDITALVWQSIRDLRHDDPLRAVMVLANLLAAAAIELATKDS